MGKNRNKRIAEERAIKRRKKENPDHIDYDQPSMMPLTEASLPPPPPPLPSPPSQRLIQSTEEEQLPCKKEEEEEGETSIRTKRRQAESAGLRQEHVYFVFNKPSGYLTERPGSSTFAHNVIS